MSKSEIDSLIESVEREAEMHPIELDAIRHVETDDDGAGITIRVLETDAISSEDQVGFQVTKPNTQMGRQVFSERLGQGLRSLASHVRDKDDESDSEGQRSKGDIETESTDDIPDTDDYAKEYDGSVPTGSETASQPTHEIGEFTVTARIGDESLAGLQKELDDAFEDISDEIPSEERIANIEEKQDDLDDRLSVLEEKLAILGSFDGGG